MFVTVEISYYPLADKYSSIVDRFISLLSHEKVKIESGKMSTILLGEYDDVMKVLTESIKELLADYPSVFNLKISNSCPI